MYQPTHLITTAGHFPCYSLSLGAPEVVFLRRSLGFPLAILPQMSWYPLLCLLVGG